MQQHWYLLFHPFCRKRRVDTRILLGTELSMACYFSKKSLVLMLKRQNCCDIMWGTGEWSLPLSYWKKFCTALQIKIPKCLSCKDWINTIDFPSDFKHDRNQRYLSLNEGKTTKPNWSEEGNVILLISYTFNVSPCQCTDLLAQRQECFCIWESSWGWMWVTQQEPNNTPVLSNVCLICAPVTLLILQDGKLVMCCAWQQWQARVRLPNESENPCRS